MFWQGHLSFLLSTHTSQLYTLVLCSTLNSSKGKRNMRAWKRRSLNSAALAAADQSLCYGAIRQSSVTLCAVDKKDFTSLSIQWRQWINSYQTKVDGHGTILTGLHMKNSSRQMFLRLGINDECLTWCPLKCHSISQWFCWIQVCNLCKELQVESLPVTIKA